MLIIFFCKSPNLYSPVGNPTGVDSSDEDEERSDEDKVCKDEVIK